MNTKKHTALWKKAEISKNPTTFKDLCPISLLWHIGKINAEKEIAKYLKLDTPYLPNQFAYIQSFATTDALVTMATAIITDLDQNR